MTKNIFLAAFLTTVFFSCGEKEDKEDNGPKEMKARTEIVSDPVFTVTEANKLVALPLHCVETEYPNKPGLVLAGEEDLKPPSELHPVFYGCFDWHSAVHGYWSMVTLLQQFPDLERAEEIRRILSENITKENIKRETAYFEAEINKSFERTYGWAWLLKLAETLHKWEDSLARELGNNLQPLTDIIVKRYKEFLPKLLYPIRTGEHPNTAFGLTFAYDYAVAINDNELKTAIEQRARDFYLKDENCPISWEPGGYDFLSPCLEEVNIMRRVLSREDFLQWMDGFLPQLRDPAYELEPGRVSDRTDGKLVHLDGLNFSRAWSLYGLANQYPEYEHLKNIGNHHVAYSYPNLIGDSYEGGHWLGSFAIYSLNTLYNK